MRDACRRTIQGPSAHIVPNPDLRPTVPTLASSSSVASRLSRSPAGLESNGDEGDTEGQANATDAQRLLLRQG
jgi:hypothetical protein